MLLSLAQWLQTLSPDYGAFRVFQYLTFRAVMAAVTALLIGLLAGPAVIRRLRELKIGQPIRGYGPDFVCGLIRASSRPANGAPHGQEADGSRRIRDRSRRFRPKGRSPGLGN